MRIKIDGMLSGTGVRDADAGGYLDLRDLHFSPQLVADIENWQKDYEDAHYRGFADAEANHRLDRRGVELAKRVKTELPTAEIMYYSAAYLKSIAL